MIRYLTLALLFIPNISYAQWHISYNTARTAAEKSKLPMLLHFHASWCGPCQMMENNVLNTPSVKSVIGSGIIAVKIDSDREPGVTRRFNVSALPTDIFLSPTGEVVGRHVGLQAVQAYTARIIKTKNFYNNRAKRITGLTGDDHIAMAGFSPVSLIKDKSWKRGDKRFAAEYDGLVYLMHDLTEFHEFMNNPAAFAPAMQGCDPWIWSINKRAILGNIRYGAFYNNRAYFFYSDRNRKAFIKNPRQAISNVEPIAVGDIEFNTSK